MRETSTPVARRIGSGRPPIRAAVLERAVVLEQAVAALRAEGYDANVSGAFAPGRVAEPSMGG
ncbi:hypothetical protein AB0K16_04410 [Nonomuraea jabiensis]|uniref:hypothetical protein n=1 Tax=Nonomuraea jabiensis TaxID=882448 RepID=UPI00344AB107